MIRLLMILGFALPAAAKGPNVLVILTDDQGWGDLSLHGNTNLRTPNIDGLAKAGAQFKNFYVQPVCSPTRAEFLTGKHHTTVGVHGVSQGGERIDLQHKTIADAFKAGGYRTASFGKWHNGSQYPYHPLGRGFEEFYGFTSGHWGEYFNPPLEHNGKDVKGDGFIADDLTNKAMQYIAKESEKPFFVYLAYNTPHSPMQVPDEYWNRFKDAEFKLKGGPKENLNHTRAAYAMIENLDWNIGRMLKMLDDKKLANDTIVVYFHDNGPNGQRWNGGLKGIKGSTDEGGVKSPLFIRWPGRIKAGNEISAVTGPMSLFPTLCNLCGIPVDEEKQTKDCSHQLLGVVGPRLSDFVVNCWNGRISVRNGDYRIDAEQKMFNLRMDPNQTKPTEQVPVETKIKLLNEFTRVVARPRLDKPSNTERPFAVGFKEFPRAVLPARDGIPGGGVKRSANAPNCSFFTNWTKLDDRMTWSIDVNVAGKYQPIVHYTCAESDVGSTIIIDINGVQSKAVIEKAHDPKLRGMEHDRVSRAGESYVKDFAVLKLPVVELPKGKAVLTLKATDIKGKTVADVRAVELNLETP